MEIELDEDADIARIARTAKVIAVVGLSADESRPSWGVARYLQAQGFRIIPVNPGEAGREILGETVYAHLSDIPREARVDMVDIFRRSSAVPAIVTEANSPTRGSTPAMMENEIASGINASATTSPANTSVRNTFGESRRGRAEGSLDSTEEAIVTFAVGGRRSGRAQRRGPRRRTLPSREGILRTVAVDLSAGSQPARVVRGIGVRPVRPQGHRPRRRPLRRPLDARRRARSRAAPPTR